MGDMFNNFIYENKKEQGLKTFEENRVCVNTHLANLQANIGKNCVINLNCLSDGVYKITFDNYKITFDKYTVDTEYSFAGGGHSMEQIKNLLDLKINNRNIDYLYVGDNYIVIRIYK
jgi:hypothetical protein